MGKMRQVLCGILVFVMMLLTVSGCGEETKEPEVFGKIYTYIGDNQSEFEFDRFTITINEDGTFSYYETMISSYIGWGKWTREGDVLTLSDDPELCYPFVNYFKVDGEDLVFIEEGSSNFLYKKIKDGERFTGASNAEY